MNLPLGRFVTVRIDAVEPVPKIDSQWSQGRDDRCPNAGSAEQARRIEVTGTVPDVPRIVEGVHVELLVDAEAELRRIREVGAAKRVPLRLVRAYGGARPP